MSGMPSPAPTEREPSPFGFHLLELMVAAGYTRQIDLAKATGISAATISRLIFNRQITPDVQTLERLGKVLGVTAQSLVAARLTGGDGSGATNAPWVQETWDVEDLPAEVVRLIRVVGRLDEPARGRVLRIVDEVAQLAADESGTASTGVPIMPTPLYRQAHD